jgi:fructokinase
MASGPLLIVGLGEILWDLFPEGKKLGGAPANFAYHARALGDEGVPASRVGMDPLGQEILRSLAEQGLPADHIQSDPSRPTGTVEVRLDAKGVPTFTITSEVAWDYLEWGEELQALAAKADAVCFGSLAQRSPRSRQTIRAFLAAARREALRVFDVNLRQSWYSAEVLGESLTASSILKLNDAELPVVLRTLGLSEPEEPEQGCRLLLDEFHLDLVCLTLGENGCLLVEKSEARRQPGVRVTVADTVGSGDAFTAALCHHRLRGASLERIGRAANRYGAWVASQVGAMPRVTAEILQAVL